MHLKLIKNNDEHQQALARLLDLMDSNPQEGSAQADELDVLSLLIEQYEEKAFPIDLPGPVEAIQFRMEQQGLSKKDMAPYFGSASRVSEVLSGKRKLSINMMRNLHRELGIPAEVLLHDQDATLSSSPDSWDTSVLKAMLERDYFEGFKGKIKDLQEYSEEWVSRFAQSIPANVQIEPAYLRSSAHQRSNDKVVDELALWAWQVRVQTRASERPLSQKYINGSVDLAFMQRLAGESWAENGPARAQEFLNHHGIHLIIEPHLPKTYLDGAVMLGEKGNPIIALCLRHDRLDNFWFTLMHELAHVALHLEQQSIFLDNLESQADLDDIEKEADEMALEALIPMKAWKKRCLLSTADVRELAKKLHISPSIVAGRYRKEMNSYKKFGGLLGRNQVRDQFNF